ncbi:hypothetical protein K5M76_06600 [Shewanella xiamenensis]|uniref:hypothetical protein n=1 Tax=Shewanella xiamenensis TaxID=332186 RepID=UPI00217D6423|nr:hypothetical protein [Shewanella xiamenensis]MCT8858346.1 hypothetical protein [Shewanella xiamenensis]UWG65891.1 hypothetical protein K5M76_06600 [Shewanella xiamenensis]
MSLNITPNRTQALNASNQLALLKLPSAKRIRILKTLGRYERALARKRIRTQTTVDGGQFEARANGKKGRMLKRLGKTLEPFVKNANRLELKHQAALTGRIAGLHQDGGSEQMSASRMARIHGTPDYNAPCSRSQAKALSAEGYKVRKAKGNGYRRASLNEIMATLSQGQAGVILRSMRDKPNKQRWEIPVAARPFLGDSADNVQRQLVSIIEQINQKRG